MGRELKNKREHEEADLFRKREFGAEGVGFPTLRSSEGLPAASSATPFHDGLSSKPALAPRGPAPLRGAWARGLGIKRQLQARGVPTLSCTMQHLRVSAEEKLTLLWGWCAGRLMQGASDKQAQ